MSAITLTNKQHIKKNVCVSHITLKASKVDETRAGKVSCFVVIDTEEEVQGECRDHGGKELHTETENREDDECIRSDNICLHTSTLTTLHDH